MTSSPIWHFVAIAEGWLFLAFGLGCLAISVVALIKCLPKNAQRFEAAFKRTKGFWMAMTGGAVALSFFGMIGGPFGFLFPVIGACMASVYLADVDPEVSG